jgi:alkylation response protein AidB-like acyl-CoA dehydrogenase
MRVAQEKTKAENQKLLDLLDGIGAKARAVDRGEADTAHALVELSRNGYAGLGLGLNRDGRLVEMVDVVRAVAGKCMSTAFSLWAHRMTAEYLMLAGLEDEASLLLAGEKLGVTAMAEAFRTLAGNGKVEVMAKRVFGGWQLNGKIRWASNLYGNAVVVTIAKLDDDQYLIVKFDIDSSGVIPGKMLELMALGSTRSSSLELKDLLIPDEQVLATNVFEFLPPVRAPFLLLQSSFCLGLTEASLASAEGEIAKGGPLELLVDEVASLRDGAKALATSIRNLANRVGTSAPPLPAELLETRLLAADLALAATRLEANAVGGRGYITGTDTSRRLREAAFIPIQSPSHVQLKWELRSAEEGRNTA